MENMRNYSISDLQIGQSVEKEFLVTEEMGQRFAELSNDYNPVHLNQEYAEKTVFKGKIAHGMLISSFISGVIGNDFPGGGSIYMSQDLKFVKPVRYGDTIKVCVEILEINIDKLRVTLQTDCFNQKDEKVISGTALVMMLI